MSGSYLIGIGALLAGFGSFLSGAAALQLARKKGKEESEVEASSDSVDK